MSTSGAGSISGAETLSGRDLRELGLAANKARRNGRHGALQSCVATEAVYCNRRKSTQVPAAIAAAFPAPRTKTTGCLSSGGLPDLACTAGALDARVTQDNVASTICVSGYTATVRPSIRVTDPIKVQQMAAYGIADQPLADEELDHLIPLELGGASDIADLWPEPWTDSTEAVANP